MNKLIKTFATIALALAGGSLFAYNGGYENALDYAKNPSVGYGNYTLTAREEKGTTIAANRYAQCKKLTSTVLTGVTSIGDAAFAYSALESVTIPGTLKTMGYIAFGGCTNLKSVTLWSYDWYEANKEPFRDCTKLVTATVGFGVPSWSFATAFPNVKTVRCPKAKVAEWQSAFPALTVLDKDANYKIVYHKYDGTTEAITNTYAYGVKSTLAALPAAWARKGLTLKGWSTTEAKANAGTVWKTAGAEISTPVAAGGTLHVYASWKLNSGWYCLRYNKNDGSGAWRTVAYEYNKATVLASIDKGLGWACTCHEFLGWATSTNNAAKGVIWRADKGTTKTPTKAGTTLNIFGCWKPLTTYKIAFNKNDGSGATYVESFDYGTAKALPSYADTKKMGWAKRGFTFAGWATSATGKVWKADKAVVSTAAKAGATLKVYAVYKVKSDSYGLRFHKNDGTDTFMLVGYTYGVKTRLPSIAGGLKWSRSGYTFKGWAYGKANADAGKVWKADWAYVSTGVKAGTTADVYALWEKKATSAPQAAAFEVENEDEALGDIASAPAAESCGAVTDAFISGTVDGCASGTFDLLVGEDGETGYVRMILDGEIVDGTCEIAFFDGKNIVIALDGVSYALSAY